MYVAIVMQQVMRNQKQRGLREEKGTQFHKMDQTGVEEIKSKRKEEEEESVKI